MIVDCKCASAVDASEKETQDLPTLVSLVVNHQSGKVFVDFRVLSRYGAQALARGYARDSEREDSTEPVMLSIVASVYTVLLAFLLVSLKGFRIGRHVLSVRN